MELTTFESTMLAGWEQVHNKAQLSLWILVAIRQKKEFADDILLFIKNHAHLEPEGQSLYRSLRRLESATLIKSIKVPNASGPDKKQFVLTTAGGHVLNAFIERNITGVIIAANTKGFFTSRKEHL